MRILLDTNILISAFILNSPRMLALNHIPELLYHIAGQHQGMW